MNVKLVEAALELVHEYEDGTGHRCDEVIEEVAKKFGVDSDELADSWHEVMLDECFRNTFGLRSMREILKEQKA